MTNQAPPPPPPPPPDQQPGEPTGRPGVGKATADKAQRSRLIGGIILAIVTIWFIMANLHKAQITFWFVTVTSPMWVTLAGTFLAGMAATLLFTRHRKQKK
jgi:uncharacterized integral membrane protein